MRIGIDASRYKTKIATGVEWYSKHIIDALLKELRKNEGRDEVVLYSREDLSVDLYGGPRGDSRGHLCEYLCKSSCGDSHGDPCEDLPKMRTTEMGTTKMRTTEMGETKMGETKMNEPKMGANIKNRVIKANRFWTLYALSKEIGKNPPDVLFVPSHTLPLKLPKRSVITIHDVAFKHLKNSYSFFQYHHLDKTTKQAVRVADKIIVPTSATADDLVKFYNCPREKISCIHHGFTPPPRAREDIFQKSEVFKYFNINPSLKYILFVGRLENKKNLQRLVKAFSVFVKKYPDYELVLAGKRGLGFREILKTINDLKLANKVIMPGYITEEEKTALYEHCEFFAFCSLYEGFGLPILEAFYHGKPVLTSNLSSMPEVGGNAALYVDPYDVESITKGMETLVKNKQYADELATKGHERLKNFSWEKAGQKTLKVVFGK